ncbi:MAG: hypothetical protein RLZZ76_323 [Candidatus Parcubacteria bacterium]|jgi:hypothetical protein
MFRSSADKNYLAMLAIPVLLSMVFGFSTTALYSDSEGDDARQRFEEVEDFAEANPTSPQNHNRTVASGSSDKKNVLLRKAIESHDYSAFTQLIIHTPFEDVMTPDAFEVLVTEYRFKKDGYLVSPYVRIS